MLSRRGERSAANQDIPWRFAPGGDNRYDAVSNPSGVIPFGTAENVSCENKYFLLVNGFGTDTALESRAGGNTAVHYSKCEPL